MTIYSCQDNNRSFIITENGYELFFHELSEVKNNKKKGRIINVKILAKDSLGKIVFSSMNNGLNGISSFYYDSISNSPFYEILNHIYIGDSVSFKMSSNKFYSSLFEKKIKINDLSNDKILDIYLKLLNYSSLEDQLLFIEKLQKKAIEKEENILKKEKEKWNKNFLQIFKSNGVYAIKIASNESFSEITDSIKNSVGSVYSIKDFYGREIYKNSNLTTEYYQTQVEGQLLEGFKIIVNKFDKGDSVLAIIPSKLMFGKRGSFVNEIPPYCPLMINLRIIQK